MSFAQSNQQLILCYYSIVHFQVIVFPALLPSNALQIFLIILAFLVVLLAITFHSDNDAIRLHEIL